MQTLEVMRCGKSGASSKRGGYKHRELGRVVRACSLVHILSFPIPARQMNSRKTYCSFHAIEI